MAAAFYKVCKYEKIKNRFYFQKLLHIFNQRHEYVSKLQRIRGEALWKRNHIQYQKQCGSSV